MNCVLNVARIVLPDITFSEDRGCVMTTSNNAKRELVWQWMDDE